MALRFVLLPLDGCRSQRVRYPTSSGISRPAFVWFASCSRHSPYGYAHPAVRAAHDVAIFRAVTAPGSDAAPSPIRVRRSALGATGRWVQPCAATLISQELRNFRKLGSKPSAAMRMSFSQRRRSGPKSTALAQPAFPYLSYSALIEPA